MGVHVGEPYDAFNPGDVGFNWLVFAGPPLTVADEPEDEPLDIRLHLHIENFVFDALGQMKLRLPNGEFSLLMYPSEDPDVDLPELGRAETPFVFKDYERHYNDRFVEPDEGDPFTIPLDGSHPFRADEELWSIGMRSAVNGDYSLVLTDFGVQYSTGMPIHVAYWALSFDVPGIDEGGGASAIPGTVQTGEFNTGVVR
jgi:hypothetical protein